MSTKSKNSSWVPAGFTVLRTPLFPIDELAKFSEGLLAQEAQTAGGSDLKVALEKDREILRQRLRSFLEKPAFREALAVSSKNFLETLDLWIQDPNSERGNGLEKALVRYFVRACSRPTPFGLFAGISFGLLSNAPSNIKLASVDQYSRFSRVDFDSLEDLVSGLLSQPQVQNVMKYVANSTLFKVAEKLHYIEVKRVNGVRSFTLAAVDASDYLVHLIEYSKDGRTIAEISKWLAEKESVSLEDATGFVRELISSQIVVPNLAIPITGSDPIAQLASDFETYPALEHAAKRLRKFETDLRVADQAGIVTPESIRQNIETQLKDFSSDENSSPLQVDMVKPLSAFSLHPKILEEVQKAHDLLCRLAVPRRSEELATMVTKFYERYADQEVPLNEVFDPETGIRSGDSADPTELLSGLHFPMNQQNLSQMEIHPFMVRVLEKFTRAVEAGKHEIEITLNDLENASFPEVPPSKDEGRTILFNVVADSNEAVESGNFRVYLNAFSGTSGTELFARFCHLDKDLLTAVREMMQKQEQNQSDVIFAEIVHQPEGRRVANIVQRPVLRNYEIPYLGRSGAPKDNQIEVSDIYVRVRNGEFELRSKRLGKMIVPRLCNAHNFLRDNLKLYRFLSLIQKTGQQMSPPSWSWGPLQYASFTPRVRYGNVVLFGARWSVPLVELEPMIAALNGGDSARVYQLMTKWRAIRKIPRWVGLRDGDSAVAVDFENILSIEAFLDDAKGSQGLVLSEWPEKPSKLFVTGPEGSFCNEFLLPFINNEPLGRSRLSESAKRPSLENIPNKIRNYAPGSEWLFAKIYTGTGTADRILTSTLQKFAAQLEQEGQIQSWFFIRYADPKYHLRLRFKGDPNALNSVVLTRLNKLLEPWVEAKTIHNWELDTYQREIERYGGVEGMELAEQIFWQDSKAVISILDSIEKAGLGLEIRWLFTLRTIDTFLSGLYGEANNVDKLALMKTARDNFGIEFGINADLKQQISDKYRSYGQDIRNMATIAGGALKAEWMPVIEEINKATSKLTPLLEKVSALSMQGQLSAPLTDLAQSYIHMHINRLLRYSHRPQELVIYNFMYRVYETKKAMSKGDKKGKAA